MRNLTIALRCPAFQSATKWQTQATEINLSQVVANQGCARGGMADTPDLGSGSARSGGSSPLARTTFRHAECKVEK
jgi:hypothetical protein